MQSNIDHLLGMALLPADEPAQELNRKILDQERKSGSIKLYKMKRPMAALLCITGLLLLSVTGYAVQKYLTPGQVAVVLEDESLADAFRGGDAVLLSETQTAGDYRFTLLGIASGEALSDHFADAGGVISEERSYCVVVVERLDGGRMPDITDEDYGDVSFFISPLIEGYDPRKYNIASMHGSFCQFVKDGILYRLTACDNMEIFADRKLYLAVQEGDFLDADAYDYDAADGTIKPNAQYDGIHILFDLPLDKSKADPAAAAAYRDQFEKGQNSSSDSSAHELITGVAAAREFAGRLTLANIDEYAVPLEDTGETLIPKDGLLYFRFTVEGRRSVNAAVGMDYFFPDGQTGTSGNYYISYDERGLDSMTIAVFTLNADGTVTYIVYIPKDI